MSVEQLYNLGSDFDNKDLRYVVADGRKYVSLFDVLSSLWGAANPREMWGQLKNNHPELAEKVISHQFSGQGQRSTPIADRDTVLQIIFLLPGQRATKYRKSAAQALIAFLNPTDELIDSLRERQEAVTANLVPRNCLINDSDRVVAVASRAYTDTHIYVRGQLPPDYVKQDTTNANTSVAMSLDVIKFGITYTLNERNQRYHENEVDNGYMMFAYSLDTREEAEAIERLLKVKYQSIRYGNSREYLCTEKLAEEYNLDVGDHLTYEKYIEIAECLFQEIVTYIRCIWNKRYTTDGYFYDVCENIPRRTQLTLTSKATIDREPLQTELSFTRNPYRMPLSCKTEAPMHIQLKIERLERELTSARERLMSFQEDVGMHEQQEKNAEIQRERKARSKGPVIGRDLLTGVEMTYESNERAAYACGYTPSAFFRTVVNKPRQFRGKHWRTVGQPYWKSPTGLHFDPETITKSFVTYIRGQPLNGDDAEIYEGVTAAATVLDCDRRALNQAVLTESEYLGRRWHTLPYNEWGTWHQDEDDDTSSEPDVSIIVNGKNGRCAGKVVLHDLKTGSETVLDSITQAGIFLQTSAAMLKLNALDKPKQIKGYSVRSVESKTRWCPPDFLKYNGESYAKKSPNYIIRENADGKSMYENIWEATGLLGIREKRQKISRCVTTGAPDHEGNHWRHATKEEYENFVPVEFTSPGNGR